MDSERLKCLHQSKDGGALFQPPLPESKLQALSRWASVHELIWHLKRGSTPIVPLSNPVWLTPEEFGVGAYKEHLQQKSSGSQRMAVDDFGVPGYRVLCLCLLQRMHYEALLFDLAFATTRVCVVCPENAAGHLGVGVLEKVALRFERLRRISIAVRNGP